MKKLTMLVVFLLGFSFGFAQIITKSELSISPRGGGKISKQQEFTFNIATATLMEAYPDDETAFYRFTSIEIIKGGSPALTGADTTAILGGELVYTFAQTDFPARISDDLKFDLPDNVDITDGEIYYLSIPANNLILRGKSKQGTPDKKSLAYNPNSLIYAFTGENGGFRCVSENPVNKTQQKILDTMCLTFSDKISVKGNPVVTLMEEKDPYRIILDTALITINEADSTQVLAIFPVTQLYKGFTYTIDFPGNIISRKGGDETEIIGAINVIYYGDSTANETAYKSYPANNSIVDSLKNFYFFVNGTDYHTEPTATSLCLNVDSAKVVCQQDKGHFDFSQIKVVTQKAIADYCVVEWGDCTVYDSGTYTFTISDIRILHIYGRGYNNADTVKIDTLDPVEFTFTVNGSEYIVHRITQLTSSSLSVRGDQNFLTSSQLPIQLDGTDKNALSVDENTFVTVMRNDEVISSGSSEVKINESGEYLILVPNPIPGKKGRYTIIIPENAVSYKCQPYAEIRHDVDITAEWLGAPSIRATAGKLYQNQYVDSVQITIESGSVDDSIIYWVSNVTKGDEAYICPFWLTQSAEVHAYAMTKGSENKSERTRTRFSIIHTLPAPVFTPEAKAKEYTNSVDVRISSTESAKIWYRFGKTGKFKEYDPMDEDFESDFRLTKTTVVEAFAEKEGMLNSDTVEVTYTVLPKLASVVANPAAGTYPDSVLVKLSAAAGASVSYRTAAGAEFAAYPATGVWIKHSCTLEAFASKEGSANSDTLKAAYTVLPKLPKPRFEDWSAGAYQDSAKVEFACDTPEVEYHYRLNETGAFLTDYTKAFYVDETTTVEVFATKDGRFGSDTAKAVFTVEKTQPVEPPVAAKDTVDAPAFVGWSAAAYQDSALVDLKCDTVEAKIFFRKGETGAFAEFTSAFYVKETTTIYAYGSKQGLENSDTLYRVYTVSKTPQGGEDPQPVDTFYVITVLANDTTMGTVSGGGRFKKDTTVVLTAVAKDGYKFVKWNDDASAEAVREVKVVSDSTFTATFEAESVTPQPVDTFYVITVLANDTTMGTVSGGGRFKKDTTVTISAVAKDGYKFVKWNDEVTEATREVKVVGDSTFTATFEKLQGVGVETTAEVAFTVYPNPNDGRFTVEVAEDATMEIYNAAGVRVLSGFVPAGRRAVSLNASGIYFVKMTAGGRSTVKRVIVR